MQVGWEVNEGGLGEWAISCWTKLSTKDFGGVAGKEK